MNNTHVLINSFKKNLKLKVLPLWIELLGSTFLMRRHNLSPHRALALPAPPRVGSAFPVPPCPAPAILLSPQCKKKNRFSWERRGVKPNP